MSEAKASQPDPPNDEFALVLPGAARLPWSAVRVQYARSSGPGGQNVNKVSSKAELWAGVSQIVGLTDRAASRLRALAGQRLTKLDEIHIASDEHRTQSMNRQEVFDRLRELIVEAMREPKPRKKTKPSRRAKQRRVDAKRRRGETKADRRGDFSS